MAGPRRGKPRLRSVRRRRRRRKRGGMARSRANTSSLVPSRSIMQGSFSGSIRNYFKTSGSTWYKSMSYSDIFGDAYASLGAQFDEYRLNSVRCYFEPAAGNNVEGSYGMCLIDADKTSATPTFAKVMSSPGSVSRKIFSGTGLHWKWTEPSDADFIPTGSALNRFVVQMATSTATPSSTKLDGELICDFSVLLRNTKGSTSKLLKQFLSLVKQENKPSLVPILLQEVTKATMDIDSSSPATDTSVASLLADAEI